MGLRIADGPKVLAGPDTAALGATLADMFNAQTLFASACKLEEGKELGLASRAGR